MSSNTTHEKLTAHLHSMEYLPLHFWAAFIATITTVIEYMWLALDTSLYYVMNSMLLVLSLTDAFLEFTDKVTHNVQIISKFFRHQMYNNIN